jgi:hypothetical protein
MEPHFAGSDKLMFYKYLDNSKIYFEFGSGGSTYQASLRKNIVKIYSVESDKEWYNTLQNKIKSDNFIFFYNEMNSSLNNWGYPGPNCSPEQMKNYSNYMINLAKEEQKSINFILIDGRFRVACCLKCFDVIDLDCLIAFDDFLDRPQYHIVLNYYDIVEKTIDNRMVILQKKKNINFISKEIIEQYELIAN